MKNGIISVILCCLAIGTVSAQGSFKITNGAYLTTSGAAYIKVHNADWNNSGTFSAGNTVVELQGDNTSGAQIKGSATHVFTKLNINRTAGTIQLDAPIQVEGDLTFVAGDIDLNSHDLTLAQPNGTLVNERNDSRVFSTSAGEIVTTAMLNMPNQVNLGNIGIELSSASNLGQTTIRRGMEQQDINICGQGIERYISIEPTTNTGLDATVRLHYFEAELAGSTETDLDIFQNNGSVWQSSTALNTGVLTTNAASDWAELDGLDGLSQYTLSDIGDVPTAEINNTGIIEFCAGDSIILTATTAANWTYQWQRNGMDIGGAEDSTYTATTTGDYALVVTNKGCSSNSTLQTVTVNDLPSASISANGATTFCENENVELAAPTGTGLSYQWQLDGMDINGATMGTYVADSMGSYTVVVTENSCSSTSTAETVEVNALPPASISASGATTFCAGENVELAAPTGTGLSYQWQLDGIDVSGATMGTYVADSMGSYTVVVTENSCSSTSAAETVTVNALPPASISASGATTFCENESVELAAPTGTGLSYQWQLDGMDISGATMRTYVTDGTGDYTVVVTESGCSTTSTSTAVIVNENPEITPTVQDASCNMQDGSVSLMVNGVVGTPIYAWSDGSTGMQLQNVGAGDYTVTVTNQSTTCSNTAMATVNAADTPMSMVSVTETNCDQATGSVTINLTNTMGVPTFLWNTGDTLQNLQNVDVGDYSVTITNGNGCTVVSMGSVAEALPPDATADGSSIDCTGDPITLQGGSSSTGVQFSWSGPNSFISMDQNPMITTAGDYALIVTDPTTGCSAMAIASVTLLGDAPTAASIIALDPLCAGIDDGSISINSVTGGMQPYLYGINNGALSMDSVFSDLAGGTYSLLIEDANGCIFLDTIELTMPVPIILNLMDISTSLDTEIEIAAPSGFVSYSWSTGDVTATFLITPQQTETYMLTVIDQAGCTASASMTVNVSGLPPNTEVDVFTPDGDGKNDNFLVSELEEDPTGFPGNEFIVFNRWGNEVFYQRDYDNSWQGTNKKGEPLPQGTYFYLILLDKSRSAFLRRGEVLLLR